MSGLEETRQPSLGETLGEEPTIGIELETDEFVSYAHARYAAGDQPGVIWYDPRDGREHLSLGAETTLDALDFEERTITSVRLHAKHGYGLDADLEGEWVLRVSFAWKTESKIAGNTYVHKRNAEHTSSHESVHEAREAAAERVPVYAYAEYRDAVEYRLGGDGS